MVEEYRERGRANALAMRIKNGRYGEGFEATYREQDNGIYGVYARYVGKLKG